MEGFEGDWGTEKYAVAITAAWERPVQQLGLVDTKAAPWIGEAVAKCYMMGMDNGRIATVLRTIDGPMSKDQKKARGLPSSSRISASFFDALTADGRIDPVFSSRAIVSRAVRSAVWLRDYASLAQSPDDWTMVFHAGPRCCVMAQNINGHSPTAIIAMPLENCQQPFCTCRLVATPPQPVEPPTNWLQVIMGVLAFAVGAALLSVLGKALR